MPATSKMRRAGPGGHTTTSSRASRPRTARARTSTLTPLESTNSTSHRSTTNAPTLSRTAASNASVSRCRADVQLTAHDHARSPGQAGGVNLEHRRSLAHARGAIAIAITSPTVGAGGERIATGLEIEHRFRAFSLHPRFPLASWRASVPSGEHLFPALATTRRNNESWSTDRYEPTTQTQSAPPSPRHRRARHRIEQERRERHGAPGPPDRPPRRPAGAPVEAATGRLGVVPEDVVHPGLLGGWELQAPQSQGGHRMSCTLTLG